MAEQLKYVSPEYQAQLDHLAETLVTRRRFGQIALEDTIEFEPLVLFESEMGNTLDSRTSNGAS